MQSIIIYGNVEEKWQIGSWFTKKGRELYLDPENLGPKERHSELGVQGSRPLLLFSVVIYCLLMIYEEKPISGFGPGLTW